LFDRPLNFVPLREESLDLLTPAEVWARDDDHHDHGPNEKMPTAQRIVMYFTVLGPVAGLIVAIALLWHRGPEAARMGWAELGLLVGFYCLTGLSITIGFHRLLTHKAFETYRPIKLFLAVIGSAAGQGMCIRWVATHRRHHQQADREGDPHSPHLHGHGTSGLLKGMFHAHVAWVFDPDKPALARSVPDLLADPLLLFIDKLYFFWVGVGILIPGLLLGWISHSWGGFWSGIIWGGLVRICLLQHATWCINSVCHVWGYRNFSSNDHSTNCVPFAILCFGEGWHNNHHAFPTSARHGMRWWEFDSSFLIITAMKKVGLAWNVRQPTESAMAAKSIRDETAAAGSSPD
jgi:stearoyl-CoA desaturase (delta-9 desaturase)